MNSISRTENSFRFLSRLALRPPGGRVTRCSMSPAAKRARTSAPKDSVHLRVGGTYYVAERTVLRSVEGSMLSAMFDPESPFGRAGDQDEAGAIIIDDRDPEAFSWILGWLRRGQLSGTPSSRLRETICTDAEFYGLDALVSEIRRLPDRQTELKVWALRPAAWNGLAYNSHWNQVEAAMAKVNELFREGWRMTDRKFRIEDLKLPYAGAPVAYQLVERQAPAPSS